MATLPQIHASGNAGAQVNEIADYHQGPSPSPTLTKRPKERGSDFPPPSLDCEFTCSPTHFNRGMFTSVFPGGGRSGMGGGSGFDSHLSTSSPKPNWRGRIHFPRAQGLLQNEYCFAIKNVHLSSLTFPLDKAALQTHLAKRLHFYEQESSWTPLLKKLLSVSVFVFKVMSKFSRTPTNHNLWKQFTEVKEDLITTLVQLQTTYTAGGSRAASSLLSSNPPVSETPPHLTLAP